MAAAIRGVNRAWRVLFPLLVLLAWARPAVGLSRQELVCQIAIAKAARTFLAGELADGARCRMDAVVGKTCDVDDRAAAREDALFKKIASRCRGVTFANLAAGGCAGSQSTLDGVVDCLVTGHRALVEQALGAELGVADE